MVPGTRLLLGQSRDRQSLDIILSPEPSSDPDDPLNWSTLRKFRSFFVVNLYSFMVAVVSLSTAVTYGALIAEFHTTASYLNVGSAVSILFIGMGNIIWNPMALRYGRRPVYILSCLLTGVAQIVAATAQRSEVFVGSRILMGFVAAPFEQLPAVTVNDQFFVHQRGFALSFLGPLATGFIVDGVGWRWVYWIFAIAMALVSILAFFLLEETGYTAVGLTSLSPLVGSMILFYVGGAGTDRFMIWQARQNNGVMEPESRIYSALVAGPIMGAGLVLYGVGASSGLPWIVPVAGMGLIGAGIPIAGEVSLGYEIDTSSSGGVDDVWLWSVELEVI
ncbi:major facilitator superfamily domain-containing protein [Ilyonectria sp. MPI-CAGE-AT-0026]|nr:major facilitator superfamily domain-containing protein [Ilyonectria sp. MPI-CAGE-AT-0026]